MQKTILIITTFNRPTYLKQCLDSIDQLTTYPDAIIISDDKSTDLETINLIQNWQPSFRCPVTVLWNTKNEGIRASLRSACDEAFQVMGAELVINLDSDAIVKPDFIKRLVSLKERFPNSIVSGFNAISDVNPIVKQYDDYCAKGYVNGINTCFNFDEYAFLVKPALEKVGNWDYNVSLACREAILPLYVTRPSCVQHVGVVSSMGHTNNGVKPDTAYDYE